MCEKSKPLALQIAPYYFQGLFEILLPPAPKFASLQMHSIYLGGDSCIQLKDFIFLGGRKEGEGDQAFF